MQALIDRIEDGTLENVSIATVVSNRQDAYALERAEKHGIHHCCMVRKAYANQGDYINALIAHLKSQQVNLVVLAGFLMILPPAFIDAFPGRIINVHPSLIPAFCGMGYYGLKVHEAVLEARVATTGATVHVVEAEVDAGPIILQQSVAVLPGDTPELLQKRVMTEAEHIILPKAVQMLSQSLGGLQ